MKKVITLVLVLALGLATEVANADFTFGTPTNLGPTVNSSASDSDPEISADGLTLYFASNRSVGSGNSDLWVTTRETINDDWSIPVNLGSTVNSSAADGGPYISADGLALLFHSKRPGGHGDNDLWVTTRKTKDDPWAEPVNLGPTVNSAANDTRPFISPDGLSLYFTSSSDRPVGLLHSDLWVSTRATTDDDWEPPVNLGPTVNSPAIDLSPWVSADGLWLFFISYRSGLGDLWVTTRAAKGDEWGPPMNLGPTVNSAARDAGLNISADGRTLYFHSDRPKANQVHDLWQAPIIPIVDLNGDGIVDSADMCIIVDHWGTDEPLCDIGPMPWGDGIVDVQDLIVLAEHLTMEVDVDANDAGSQVELEQGQILVVTLESNPTTGYRWEVVETQESILQQMGEAEFKPSETGEPPLIGAGGWEIFRFKAISAGQMTLQLVYHRPWEEGVEPLKTFSLQVVVR